MLQNELIDASVLNNIKEELLMRKESIAVGESVTSGLLQAAFSQAEDAMQFYQGGITAYNVGQKYRHLNIEPIHSIACHSVSDQVARGMARNSCRLFSSDWGIGITGYASPVPESDQQIYAWFAIAHGDEVVLEKKISPQKDHPFRVQLVYVHEVLQAFAQYLRSNPKRS